MLSAPLRSIRVLMSKELPQDDEATLARLAQGRSSIAALVAALQQSAIEWRVVYDASGEDVALRILKGIEDNLLTLGAPVPLWLALLPRAPR